MDKGTITVAIYTHPELYPPVLNAIDELSAVYETVQVVHRNVERAHWAYPNNVRPIVSGEYIPVRDSERASTQWKIRSFIEYTRTLYRTLKSSKSDWVMCNDHISLFSFRLVRPFIKYPIRLWYHNHDVVELGEMRKYSIGYYALKSEWKQFGQIDLFTLPSEPRIKYFPIELLKGKWLLVPNYPSIKRMSISQTNGWKTGESLKIIYQGRVSDEHGLEEILDYVKKDKGIEFTIIGPGNPEYVAVLREKIAGGNISGQVQLLNPVPYSQLSEITARHHIGLAVNKPLNILYSTAALASNKIYEYAAAGLPILYYKDKHYEEVLSKFPWAFPTNLSLSGLAEIFGQIRAQYEQLSDRAKQDFVHQLNFGISFRPVLSVLTAS